MSSNMLWQFGFVLRLSVILKQINEALSQVIKHKGERNLREKKYPICVILCIRNVPAEQNVEVFRPQIEREIEGVEPHGSGTEGSQNRISDYLINDLHFSKKINERDIDQKDREQNSVDKAVITEPDIVSRLDNDPCSNEAQAHYGSEHLVYLSSHLRENKCHHDTNKESDESSGCIVIKDKFFIILLIDIYTD